MADEASGISSLFQNNLFMQYLAGLGSDLSAAGADTSKGFQPNNLNAITQQNIQSQNTMKLLKTLLGPDGTKATFSNTGVNLTIPKESKMFSELLQGTGEGGVWEGMAPPLGTPKQAPVNTPSVGGGSSVVNPFQYDLDIPASDLAGLSSQDIMGALGMRLKRDEQIGDTAYKNKLMQEIDTRIAAAAPVYEIPGIGKVNASQYMDWLKLTNERKPNEAKLYEYAIAQGFKGSFEDFENRSKTTHMKDYEAAVKGGYKGDFNTWMTQMAKAGAINLGDKIEEKKKMSELEGQFYFDDPKWTADVNKQVDTFNKDQAWLIPENERPLAVAKVKVKAIEDKIAAGGGNIQKVVMDKDGKTMIWTVQWPSGDVKVIKHAVK